MNAATSSLDTLPDWPYAEIVAHANALARRTQRENPAVAGIGDAAELGFLLGALKELCDARDANPGGLFVTVEYDGHQVQVRFTEEDGAFLYLRGVDAGDVIGQQARIDIELKALPLWEQACAEWNSELTAWRKAA